MSLTSELIALARSAGAVSAGAARVETFDEARDRIAVSIENGMAGPLGFTYRDPETSTDLEKSLPWAESLLVFGVPYIHDADTPGETGPVVGRFATRDFYDPVRRVASVVATRLRGEGARTETLIDDSRLVDRSAAIRAGVGWPGRSTMVLAPGAGPWMLLGSVATDAKLRPSPPMKRGCGTCTACIPACPTGAIVDGALDARKCLSTWLQTPGSIPHWVRPVLGRRIYGCDDCLTSCPPGHPAMGESRTTRSETTFVELLSIDDETLLERFSWWFVPRRDGRYIRRNLLVAAGNSGEESAFPQLERHLGSRSSMIRGHAAWALARSGHPSASSLLREALTRERASEARDEVLMALIMLEQPEFHTRILVEDERVTSDSERTALGLIEHREDDDQRGPGFKLLTIQRDSPPEATAAELARAVRVNDRDRVLEKMRRRARGGTR